MSGVISRAIQDRALPLDPNDQPILLSEYLEYCADKDYPSEEETAALVQDFLEFQESPEFRERRLMSAWHQMAAEEMIPIDPEDQNNMRRRVEEVIHKMTADELKQMYRDKIEKSVSRSKRKYYGIHD